MGAGPESTARGNREPARRLSEGAARPDTLFIGDLRADLADWQRGEGYRRQPFFKQDSSEWTGFGHAGGPQQGIFRGRLERGFGVERLSCPE
jgi:hypothetical protein